MALWNVFFMNFLFHFGPNMALGLGIGLGPWRTKILQAKFSLHNLPIFTDILANIHGFEPIFIQYPFSR
jgi:hypothetical protein